MLNINVGNSLFLTSQTYIYLTVILHEENLSFLSVCVNVLLFIDSHILFLYLLFFQEALDPPLDDFEVTETTTAAEVIKYEYHVLYSCSYQVPVLYFRASFLGKTMLEAKCKFITFTYNAESRFGKLFLREEKKKKKKS